MSADTIPACPLALMAEDLSHFRDGDLSADRAQSIAGHLASCPACTECLAEYARIGSGLGAIAEPTFDGSRFWRDVAVRMVGRRQVRASDRAPLRGAVTGLGAVAAVFLVAIAFAQLLASHGGSPITAAPTSSAGATPTATNAATPTVAPGPSVTWKQLAFPDTWDHPQGCSAPSSATPSVGVGVTCANVMLGFSAADSNTLYACDGASGTYFIWISHDHGATWSREGTLPSNQPAQCKVIVDSINAQTAIVHLGWYEPGASPLQPSGLNFATTNGGRSWTELSGNYDYAQIATYRSTVYALRLDAPGDPNQRYHLMASSDGMHTWRQLDQTFADASTVVSAFWLDPANGSILAYASVGSGHSFWGSPDAGTSWRQVSTPDSDFLQTIAVQWPYGGNAWHICIAGQPVYAAPVDQHNKLSCTSDGGKTWTDRPALDVTLTCNCLKGRPFTSISALSLVGIAPDGSLLATVLDRYDVAGQAHVGLYRLTPGGSTWERLGDTTADGHIFLLPSGVLWMSGWQPTNPASFWTQASFVSTGTYP